MLNSIAIADKHKDDLKEIILDFFKDFSRHLSVDNISELDMQQFLNQLYSRLDDMEKELNASKFIPTLDLIFEESGNNIINILPKGSFLAKYRFDIFYENTFDIYKRHRVQTTRELAYDSIRAVRQYIERALRENQDKEEILRGCKKVVGLNPMQEQAAHNYMLYLQNGDRQALQNKNRNSEYDDIVLASIISGKLLSSTKINKLTSDYINRSKLYRVALIAETESIGYAEMGEYESIIQAGMLEAVDLSNLKKIWVTQKDERVRANHQAIPAMNPDGVGILEYFRTPLGLMRYPHDNLGVAENVINCRCYLKYSKY